MGGESYVTHGMCPRDKPFDNDDEAMKVSWMGGFGWMDWWMGTLVCVLVWWGDEGELGGWVGGWVEGRKGIWVVALVDI